MQTSKKIRLILLATIFVALVIVSHRAILPIIAARGADQPPIVTITASRFQFTPSQIVLHQGQPVTLQLTSSDRAHGFMIRALNIDTDIEPGRTKTITVTPRNAGKFTAICDHYCGIGHTKMKMTIVVEGAAANASQQAPPARS